MSSQGEPRAPLTTTTSLWPAMAVVGIAVVMLVVFMVINLVANQGVGKQKAPSTTPLVVGGLTAMANPPRTLTYCNQRAEVPGNITDAFVLPASTTYRPGATNPDSGAGEYDCEQPFSTAGASATALLSFYDSELQARGWDLFSKGGENGAPQSLFQKAGTDGFYWVVGVTVKKTTATSVDWTFTIYQNSETI